VTKTDEELCSASAEGDEAAFAELVRRYQSCVCAITFAATGRRDLSEDLAQETFIIAWRKLATIEDPTRVGAWLCGIARNLARKSHRRRVDHPFDERDARDGSATPEDELAQRRARARLWERLESLPDGYREALVMFYREERSAPRVAEHLGISLAAAQQRLSRGRKMLGAQVDPDEAQVLSEGPGPRFAQGVVLALPALEPASVVPPPSGSTVSVLGTVLKALAMKKVLAVVAGVIVVLAIAYHVQSVSGPARAEPTTVSDSAPTLRKPLGEIAGAEDSSVSRQVCGVVRDADDDRPLAAVVTITQPMANLASPGNPAVLAVARTSAVGRWCADRLQGGAYTATATSPGHLPAVGSFRIANADAVVDLSLHSGGRQLTGTVVDVGGGPVAGALVSARGVRTSGTLTDDEGKFRLSLPEGSYTVTASEPDYQSTKTHATMLGRDAEIELSLVPGATLAGVVLDRRTGQPMPNMTLDWDYSVRRGAARSGGAAAPHERVVTDEAGRFDLRQLSAGQYELFAAGNHRASQAPSVVSLEIAEQRTDVVVFVDDAANARGHVRFDDGTPAVDAQLRVVHAEHDHRVHTRTNAEGEFVLHGLLPGRYSVMVTGQGLATSLYGVTIEVPAEGDPEPMDITVEHTTTVAGRLAPAMRGRVTISPASDGMDRMIAWTKTQHVRTESDADGRFSLAEVPPGVWNLVATAVDGSEARRRLDVPETGLDDVLLELERRALVRGSVADAEANPVGNARLVVVAPAEGSEGERNVEFATSDANGVFTVTGLEPGRYVLRGRAETGARLKASDGSTELAVFQVEGTGEQSVSVVAVAPAARVEGRVVDESGAPLADAWVTLSDDEDNTRAPILTGDDGAFVFEGVPDAGATIEATHGDARATAAVEPRTGRSVELTVERLASLRGRVTHEGKPVEQFEIRRNGASDRRFVAADGSFELTRLLAEQLTLTVVADVGSVKRTVALTPGETAEVVVELGGWGSVRGRAVDLAGEPVAGIEVSVMSEAGDRDGGSRTLERLGGGGLTTDADGRFEVDGLGAGRGSLMIGSEKELLVGGRVATKYFPVKPGEVTELGDVLLIELKISDPKNAGTFGLAVDQPPDVGRLAIPTDATTLTVRAVEPGGPAAQAGLQVGMRISAIAGYDVAAIGPTTAALLLTPGVHEAGHPLELSVAGEDGLRRFHLVATPWDGS